MFHVLNGGLFPFASLPAPPSCGLRSDPRQFYIGQRCVHGGATHSLTPPPPSLTFFPEALELACFCLNLSFAF